MSTTISRKRIRREYIPTPAQIRRSVAEIQQSWSEEDHSQRLHKGANGFRFLTAMIKQREIADGVHSA